MVMPCACCDTGAVGCAMVGVQFTGVSETASQAGWTPTNLNLTIDGVVNDPTISGYTSPGGNTPSTTLRVTYTHSTPQNRVVGLRVWNQGGGNLNDADGLNHFTAEFYAGATLLATQTWQSANGAAPTTHTLPLGLELNGVDSVVLRTLDKQTTSTVAPLWRELQLLEFQPVFPCRRNGVMEWYDANGNQVANADVQSCETPPQPFLMPDLHLAGAAFGDDPSGTAENLCAVSPAPSATSGWAAPVGGCYDPVVGNPTMDWGPTTSVEMTYDDNGNGQASGGVFVQFSSPSLAPTGITWPTNFTMMYVGEQRLSNVFGGGHRAVLTYVSGPPQTDPAGTIRMEGGVNIGIHRTATNNVAGIRFRLDFISA